MSTPQSNRAGVEAIHCEEPFEKGPDEREQENQQNEEVSSVEVLVQQQQQEQEAEEEEDDDDDDEMLKRLRLRRSSDGSDDMERNEHGLVTRMRRSFKKSHLGSKAAPVKPMFATVCANNVNRSMEAHLVLQKAGLRVCSFGAGVEVCFPGLTADSPRVFGFGTTYETMYQKLKEEDEARYKQVGVLQMLERNMAIKRQPQRFQSLLNKQLGELDVVVCLDYRMFIRVLNDLRMRFRLCFNQKRLHIVCLDVEDTPEAAESGGTLALELCTEINDLPDASEDKVKDIIVRFEQRHKIDMFYVGISV